MLWPRPAILLFSILFLVPCVPARAADPVIGSGAFLYVVDDPTLHLPVHITVQGCFSTSVDSCGSSLFDHSFTASEVGQGTQGPVLYVDSASGGAVFTDFVGLLTNGTNNALRITIEPAGISAVSAILPESQFYFSPPANGFDFPGFQISRVGLIAGASVNTTTGRGFYQATMIIEGRGIVPVILVHGWCEGPEAFGSMRTLLNANGLTVAEPFDYSALTEIPLNTGGGISIEELAADFGGYVKKVLSQYPGANAVDVVTHSMGGLVVRAWMTGMVTVPVPYNGEIRRLVTIASPHYGAEAGELTLIREAASLVFKNLQCSPLQQSELDFGSTFIETLHDRWIAAQNSGLFNSLKTLFIAGTVGSILPSSVSTECDNQAGCDDGVVDFASATLPDASDDTVRYVPYKHSRSVPFPIRGRSSAFIDNATHPSFQLANAFLSSGTILSQDSLGYTPPQNRKPAAKRDGLVLLRFANVTGKRLVSASVRFTPAVSPLQFATQVNVSAATLTLWGAPEGTYTITVQMLGRPAISLPGIQIRSGHPTVPPPIIMP